MNDIFTCPDCGFLGIAIESANVNDAIREELPMLKSAARKLLCRMIVTDVQCRECGWSTSPTGLTGQTA